MATTPQLEQVDNRFIAFYEQARLHVIEEQKARGLLILVDDQLQLFHSDKPVHVIDGLQPLAYNRLKTTGHMPLALLCMLHDVAGDDPLPQSRFRQLADYAEIAKAAAQDFDLSEEIQSGYVTDKVRLYQHCIDFMNAILEQKCVRRDQLASFAREAKDDINVVLAGAARAQLDACHERVTRIKNEILSADEWRDLWVLILGNYMARQGQLFLQYFARVLHTTEQDDRRLVYFEGGDMDAALERLGTVMLDAHASQAIFADRDRLHRDVLADETSRYLDTLLAK